MTITEFYKSDVKAAFKWEVMKLAAPEQSKLAWRMTRAGCKKTEDIETYIYNYLESKRLMEYQDIGVALNLNTEHVCKLFHSGIAKLQKIVASYRSSEHFKWSAPSRFKVADLIDEYYSLLDEVDDLRDNVKKCRRQDLRVKLRVVDQSLESIKQRLEQVAHTAL